jgi:hypothetical protein
MSKHAREAPSTLSALRAASTARDELLQRKKNNVYGM